jgi:membrane protein YqaA with SNARE-associated domain
LIDYLVLFGSAFLAATILPFYSEAVLLFMLTEGQDPLLLFLVATTGNTLGSVVNWFLGRYLLTFQHRKWFWFKPQQIQRAQDWFKRRGIWSLLFAWLPVGGDALTLIAGVMRIRLPVFIALVAVGKGIRYGAVMAFGQVVPIF